MSSLVLVFVVLLIWCKFKPCLIRLFARPSRPHRGSNLQGNRIYTNTLEDVETFDIRSEDPRLALLEDATQAGNWQLIRDTLAETPTDPATRRYLMDVVVKTIKKSWEPFDFQSDENYSEMLSEWEISEPESMDCLILQGRTLVDWAWHARGYGLGYTVQERAKPVFQRRLGMARRKLQCAQQLNPRDSTIYYPLMMVALGSQPRDSNFVPDLCKGIKESDDPLDPEFHKMAIEFFSPRWGGSFPSMMNFVYEINESIPPGYHPARSIWLQALQMFICCGVGVRQLRSTISQVSKGVIHSLEQSQVLKEDFVEPTDIRERYELLLFREEYVKYMIALGQRGLAKRLVQKIGNKTTLDCDKYLRYANSLEVELGVSYGTTSTHEFPEPNSLV